jgi:hypothetical protein
MIVAAPAISAADRLNGSAPSVINVVYALYSRRQGNVAAKRR